MAGWGFWKPPMFPLRMDGLVRGERAIHQQITFRLAPSQLVNWPAQRTHRSQAASAQAAPGVSVAVGAARPAANAAPRGSAPVEPARLCQRQAPLGIPVATRTGRVASLPLSPNILLPASWPVQCILNFL